MPWKTVSVMDQRYEFVRLALNGSVSISELCHRFNVSRDTGYRLIRRYREQGLAGLEDLSRRPKHSPQQTPPAMEQAVLDVRDHHPAWGGRKIARRLEDLGFSDVPCPSTVTDILRRHGRLDADKSVQHQAFQRFEHEHPNDLWQMDFKGHFAAGPGRCHPLTVLDDHSRYALGLQACDNETDVTVRERLTGIFRRYGMPHRILADNGSPWGGGRNDGTYSALGVWLLRLGIGLSHGRPYHPQTQGKDERFHRTLKAEVLDLRQFNDLKACQSAFDAWRMVYNYERPHEALRLKTPSTRYSPSKRPFPEQIPLPQYDEGEIVRKVGPDGYFAFNGRKLKISQAFRGYRVAMRPTKSDALWNVCFASFIVAQVNLRDNETLV